MKYTAFNQSKSQFKFLGSVVGTLLFSVSLTTAVTTFSSVNQVHAATVQTSNKDTYVVQKGDSLSKIGSKYGLTVAQLKQLNHLSSDLIHAGESLLVSSNASNTSQYSIKVSTSTSSSSSTYTKKTVTTSSTSLSDSEKAAQDYIAQHESSGSYTAKNGKYYGKYQLDKSYLNGDYSSENQEKTATKYMQGRYGTWANAMKFWQTHNWW